MFSRQTSGKLVVIGGQGDGIVIAEAIRCAQAAGYPVELVGFLNDALPSGQSLMGVPVLGHLEDWRMLPGDLKFAAAIQKVMDMPRRADRIEGLGIPDCRWATVHHPRSFIASDVEIGVGCYIASFATIQPGCRLGRFASVRAGANIGHHSVVEDHCYVGPNATLCGRTHMKVGAHLGPNGVLLDNKTMGRFSVVGVGGVATKDIRDYAVVMGNPARRVGKVKPGPEMSPPTAGRSERIHSPGEGSL